MEPEQRDQNSVHEVNEQIGSDGAVAGESSAMTNAERSGTTSAARFDTTLSEGLETACAERSENAGDDTDSEIVVEPGMKLDLIDETMARELAEYGIKHRRLNIKLHIAAFAFGALVLGFIPGLFSINIWPYFLIAIGIATMYSSMLATRVSTAYNNHQYRVVTKRMNTALWWNQLCSPLTLFSFVALSRIQARMLLVQGRYMEMEALLLICRASAENKVEWDGLPKSTFIANDLACTYLAQGRYEDAAKLLNQILESKKHGQIVPFAVVNLALCYTKLKNYDAARHVLDDYANQVKRADKLLRVRDKLIRAVVDIETKKFETVDERLEELIHEARAMSESNEFLAACYLAFAKLREYQSRDSEAELHFCTAIDLFKSNDNPSYWCLAEAIRAYAEMLTAQGRTAEALAQIQIAGRYEAAYFEREIMRMTYLRYRITQEKPVHLLSDLVNVDGFPPLSIEIAPPELGLEKEPAEES